MIDVLFQHLGFTQNEIAVYLALADMGKSTASLIAKRADVPRSTAYSALDLLEKRGLLSIEHDGSQALYFVHQPSALKAMVGREKEQQQKEIEKREVVADELASLVGPYFNQSNYSIPRLQFFDGPANVETMLRTYCFEWQQSITQYDSTWWGYQDHHFVEQYQPWLNYYWKNMQDDEKINLFSNESTIEKKLRGHVAKRTIKIVPKEFEFSSTIWALGDYVIMIMTRQKPHYAFQLKDAVFAANQRKTFQLLWQSRT